MDLNRILTIAHGVGQGTGNNILCRCSGRCVVENILSATGTRRVKGKIIGVIKSFPILLRGVTAIGVNDGDPGLKATSRQTGPTILVAIAGRPGADAVSLARGLSTVVTSLRGGLPTSIRISASVFHRDHFVSDSVSGIGGDLFRNDFFIIVILFLFLVGVHAAIVSLITLPLSLLISVLALRCVKLAVGAVDLKKVTVTVNSLISSTVISIRGMCGQVQRGRLLPSSRRHSVLRIIFSTSHRMHVPVLGSALVVIIDFIPLFFLDKVRKHVLIPLKVTFVITLFTSAIITLALAPILYDCLLGQGPASGGMRGRT